jgi:aminopeptidase N
MMPGRSAHPPRVASRLVFTALLVALAVVAAGCGDPLAGSVGIGDPYVPEAGNGGYDALHYDLDLTVDPVSSQVDGVVTIQARATQDLDSFDLDFVWDDQIGSVTVDNTASTWEQSEGELKIATPGLLKAQQEFSVQVAYSGRPGPLNTRLPFEQGWQHRGDVIYTIDEPRGANTWFPANDHPVDKATYTFRVTVPKPYVAAANGVLTASEDKGTDQTFVWEMEQPMASYAASLTIADYQLKESVAPNGVVIRNYFDPSVNADCEAIFASTGEALAYFAQLFGPYPFDVYGVAVPAAEAGAAMENQTLSLYGQDVIDMRMTGDAATREVYLSHELAHQWFGDSVSVERWQDIWLNEGFATYASFLWLEHRFGPQAMKGAIEDSVRIVNGQREPPLSDPGLDGLFSPNVYRRGALTLHALRLTVGDDVFFAILKEWATRHQYGNATTEEFMALAEEVATNVPAEQLTKLFHAWLDETALPDLPSAGAGS